MHMLVALTSAWVEPVNETLLPKIRALLDAINAQHHEKKLVEFLLIRRISKENSTSDDIVQRLDPLAFRWLCKQFQVTDLPACVLLDATGHALMQELLQHFEDQHEDDAASTSLAASKLSWTVLEEILKDNGVSTAVWNTLWPLWQTDVTAVRSRISEMLEVDDVALVKIRQKALELFETGDFLSAASRFVNVLMCCPTCTKSSFNLAVILHAIGETYFAVGYMLRVVALDDSDSVAHTVLRSVYYLNEPDLVVAGYHSIISANGDRHVRAAHSLATLKGATTTRTAAPAYVAEVFDELADCFEEKLVAHLEYRVPWQLVEALQILSPPGFISQNSTTEPTWIVADVGCGTGLCGRLLRPHVKHIIGVDISPLMIEKTRAKGSYDELHTIDIVPFLHSCADESLDLVISADVWIYVGALEQVFELSKCKLRASTGWMVFSIELLTPRAPRTVVDSVTGFRLAPSGRFQHSHEYIASLATQSGFSFVLQEDISVRKESTEPIPGRIYILQRNVTPQKQRPS